MNSGIFSLYWDNVDDRIVINQKKVFDDFKVHINQHRIDRLDHGEWMDWVMSFYNLDAILFVDVDCIPLNGNIVTQSLEKAASGSLLGPIGCANHLDPNRVYAAPAWCAINRHLWLAMNRPSAKATRFADVGQNWSDAFVQYRQKVELLPVTNVDEPQWNLPGMPKAFGIGTTYADSVYHLFQCRLDRNIEKFVSKCGDIRNPRAPSLQAVVNG